MTDEVDELFGDFYPGSNKKRREKPASVELIPDDDWRQQFHIKTIGGEEVKMYTIGSLATALQVSVSSIRKWINHGYLPQAPYRMPSNMKVRGQTVEGRRLYTEQMIEALVYIFEDEGVLGARRIEWKDHSDITIRVSEAWTMLLSNNSNPSMRGNE